MKTIICSVVAALIYLSGSLSYGIDKKILNAAGIQELKQEAPDFTLVGQDGAKISLKEIRGKVVIIHIWATWCKPCQHEFPFFEKVYQGFKGKDVVFLPIAIDLTATQEEINASAKKLGGTFPVYLAREGSVTDRYWTWGVPATYFIDKRGWIAGRTMGQKDWESESVNAVINALLEEK